MTNLDYNDISRQQIKDSSRNRSKLIENRLEAAGAGQEKRPIPKVWVAVWM